MVQSLSLFITVFNVCVRGCLSFHVPSTSRNKRQKTSKEKREEIEKQEAEVMANSILNHQTSSTLQVRKSIYIYSQQFILVALARSFFGHMIMKNETKHVVCFC